MKNSSKIFKKHNHSNCSKQALKAFEKHCFEKNLQVTPLRKKILEYLLKDHRPLGAYEILDLLRKEGFSSTPPIAYRVLDFLIAEGFAHKIKGLNAFVACTEPGNVHSPMFMICRKCKKVAEVSGLEDQITFPQYLSDDFNIENTMVELLGVCTSCGKIESARC